MKKILLAILALTLTSFAQSPIRYTAALTATCSNANTTCSGTANSALDVSAAGYLTALITANGTYAGSTIAFEMSDDGGITYYPQMCSRSDAAATETSEVLPTNTARSWLCAIPGVIRMRVRQTAYGSGTPNIAMTLSAVAISSPVVTMNAAVGSTDPCQDTNIVKSSTPITVAAATQQLVALSAGKTTYVCGMDFVATGTVLLEYGTSANCAAGTTSLSGTYTASTVAVATAGTIVATPASDALCLVSGTSTQGILTYVQQ